MNVPIEASAKQSLAAADHAVAAAADQSQSSSAGDVPDTQATLAQAAFPQGTASALVKSFSFGVRPSPVQATLSETSDEMMIIAEDSEQKRVAEAKSSVTVTSNVDSATAAAAEADTTPVPFLKALHGFARYCTELVLSTTTRYPLRIWRGSDRSRRRLRR